MMYFSRLTHLLHNWRLLYWVLLLVSFYWWRNWEQNRLWKCQVFFLYGGGGTLLFGGYSWLGCWGSDPGQPHARQALPHWTIAPSLRCQVLNLSALISGACNIDQDFDLLDNGNCNLKKGSTPENQSEDRILATDLSFPLHNWEEAHWGGTRESPNLGFAHTSTLRPVSARHNGQCWIPHCPDSNNFPIILKTHRTSKCPKRPEASC